MKKKQMLFAIVFGAMLAITGCGDDETSNGGGDGGSSGSGGSAGTGGSGGDGGSSGTGGSAGTGGGDGSFCGTVCGACSGGSTAECTAACEQQLGAIPPQFNIDDCPNEAGDVGTCIGNNGCDSACQGEWTAWAECVFLP